MPRALTRFEEVMNPVCIIDGDGKHTGTNDNPLPVTLSGGAGGATTQQLLMEAIPGSPDDVHAPAANTAATVTYAAMGGYRHVVTGFALSYYGGIPTGGNVTITSNGGIIFNLDISEEGAGEIIFPSPKKGGVGATLVITLTAGGAGITGKLNILNHWTEAA